MHTCMHGCVMVYNNMHTVNESRLYVWGILLWYVLAIGLEYYFNFENTSAHTCRRLAIENYA